MAKAGGGTFSFFGSRVPMMMAGIAANGVSSISEAGIRFGMEEVETGWGNWKTGSTVVCTVCTLGCLRILSTASRTEDARRLWTSMATTTGVGESRQGLLSHRQP